MIDWLLNDILRGSGQEGLFFQHGFLADAGRLLQCLTQYETEVWR